MQSMMQDCFEQLADEAGNLTRLNKRATLTAREVQVGGDAGGRALSNVHQAWRAV